MDPRILDAKGREIRVGDRVRTPYGSGTLDGVLNVSGPGNPILRVARDTGHPFRFSTRPERILGLACPDLQLLDDREESSNGN